MRLFIAGGMTGYPDFNYPAFDRMAAHLRADGHEVLNPAENHNRRQDLAHEVYLLTTIRQIVGPPAVDGVVVLPRWQRSIGARLEVDVARAVGIPILFSDLEPVPAVFLHHR